MLQGGEIIIILLIALIVLGPTRLPELAQKLGKWTAELRAAVRDVRQGLEAEVADLKKVGEDLKKPIEDLKKPIEDAGKSIEEAGVSRLDWTGPKPVSGPTPEDAIADLEDIEKETGDEGGP
jgi:Tat protein translocase TatB subunit